MIKINRNIFFVILLSIFCRNNSFASDTPQGFTENGNAVKGSSTPEEVAQRNKRMQWWRDAKFGLFIHWGVYSVPAWRGEWVMLNDKIPVARYRDYAGAFTARSYDPNAWAKLAKEAGVKYVIITSKHHDGFALYDTKVSDWHADRDLLSPLANAVRAEGLKFGLYYSQAQDWVNIGGAKAKYEFGGGWDKAHMGNFDDYLKNVSVPQTREILSRFQPDILWWDTSMGMTKEQAKPFNDLLSLRPGIITNNRLGGGYSGDIHTPEQFIPLTNSNGDWETCMTMNNSWGYNATDSQYKSVKDLIRKLAEVVSKGGNFLLNIGPRHDGTIPEESIERLQGIGKWLDKYGDSIYSTKAGPFSYLSYGFSTQRGDNLYVQVLDWPIDGKLNIPLVSGVKSVHLLASDNKELPFVQRDDKIVVSVPQNSPDPIAAVLVVKLDGTPVVKSIATQSATFSTDVNSKDTKNISDGTSNYWRAPQNIKEASINISFEKEDIISAVAFDEPDVWPRVKQEYRLEALINGVWTKIDSGKTEGHGIRKNLPSIKTSELKLTLSAVNGGPGLAELQLYRPE